MLVTCHLAACLLYGAGTSGPFHSVGTVHPISSGREGLFLTYTSVRCCISCSGTIWQSLPITPHFLLSSPTSFRPSPRIRVESARGSGNPQHTCRSTSTVQMRTRITYPTHLISELLSLTSSSYDIIHSQLRQHRENKSHSCLIRQEKCKIHIGLHCACKYGL
ncbi:hypothetical protein F4775DRAFT_571168 [Biscogniauxia sp. FL1348]|nr:hypothetical protein F4775DRAFT_571168 [Biscogniauxia sp. FL1348]